MSQSKSESSMDAKEKLKGQLFALLEICQTHNQRIDLLLKSGFSLIKKEKGNEQQLRHILEELEYQQNQFKNDLKNIRIEINKLIDNNEIQSKKVKK